MLSPNPVPFCVAALPTWTKGDEDARLIFGGDSDAGVLHLENQQKTLVGIDGFRIHA